jgi:hypothetical protein
MRALAVVLCLAGCECGPDAASRDAGPRAIVIEGTVRIAEGAEAPMWPQNPLVLPPPRPAIPEQCTPPQEGDRRPVVPTADGALPGVVVMLGDFEGDPPHEPETHDVHIRDCRLTPSIVVATRGDTLHLHNDTPEYSFMPDLSTGLMTAILPGDDRELALGEAGVRTLQCGFLAPCGRAEIVVLYHPLHAITDAEGHYRIEGVPAGSEIRIAAWHPLFQDDTQTITLRAGEHRTIDFTIRPARLRAPAPPPEHDGPAENNPDVLF